MHAGMLNRRIVIQQYIPMQDSSGSTVEAWSKLAMVWAAIRPLRGREYYAANQTQAEITHEITIRWRRDIGAANRVLFGSRVLEIEAAVNPDEANEWLIMMCREKA